MDCSSPRPVGDQLPQQAPMGIGAGGQSKIVWQPSPEMPPWTESSEGQGASFPLTRRHTSSFPSPAHESIDMAQGTEITGNSKGDFQVAKFPQTLPQLEWKLETKVD